MSVNSEFFVMCIYTVSIFLMILILKKTKIAGRNFFLLSFFFYFLSNIFTVVETYWFRDMFNAMEHLTILLGSFFLMAAVIRLTAAVRNSSEYFRNEL